MTDDIKDLLGRAIGSEPPLGLDRDEVVKAGRKRLRRRRALEAGGVVGAVVVAVVGASLLSGVVGTSSEQDRLPPAASSTNNGPLPGIDLPLPPSSTDRATRPLNTEHADVLTGRLMASSVINQLGGLSVDPTNSVGLGFRIKSGAYVFDADVVSDNTDGALQVSVQPAEPSQRPDCRLVPESYDSCEVKDGVAVARWKNSAGEKKVLVLSVNAGSKVVAVATNVSAEKLAAGRDPAGRDPILSEGSLTKLVLYAGLAAQ